jgi:hypothetical protein
MNRERRADAIGLQLISAGLAAMLLGILSHQLVWEVLARRIEQADSLSLQRLFGLAAGVDLAFTLLSIFCTSAVLVGVVCLLSAPQGSRARGPVAVAVLAFGTVQGAQVALLLLRLSDPAVAAQWTLLATRMTLVGAMIGFLALGAALERIGEHLSIARDPIAAALAGLSAVLHFGESLWGSSLSGAAVSIHPPLTALLFRMLTGVAAYGLLLLAVVRISRALPFASQGPSRIGASLWRSAARGLKLFSISVFARVTVAAATAVAVSAAAILQSRALIELVALFAPVATALCAGVGVVGLARLRGVPQPQATRTFAGLAMATAVLAAALEVGRLAAFGSDYLVPGAELALVDLLRQGSTLIALLLSVGALRSLALHLGEGTLAFAAERVYPGIAFVLGAVSLLELGGALMPLRFAQVLSVAAAVVFLLMGVKLAAVSQKLADAVRCRTRDGLPPPIAHVVADC